MSLALGLGSFVCLLYVSTRKIWKTSGQGEASRAGVPLSLGIYWEEGKALLDGTNIIQKERGVWCPGSMGKIKPVVGFTDIVN